MRIITDEDVRIELEQIDVRKPDPTNVGDYYVRFMSMGEYYALMEGNELVNKTKHYRGHRTASFGFCFMPIDRSKDVKNQVRDFHEFLVGVACDEIAVVLRNEACAMTESYGVYADPWGDWDDVQFVTEFCTTQYDRSSMVPVEAFWDFDWHRARQHKDL
jgi:hypothetical protein